MDDADLDPSADELVLEQALAGVTAAVDGFAEPQQNLLARDYSADLALIHESCEGMRGAIAASGRRVRHEADAAISNIRKDMQNAVGEFNSRMASVGAVQQQN